MCRAIQTAGVKTCIFSTLLSDVWLETYSESFSCPPNLTMNLHLSSPTERVMEVLNDFYAAIMSEEEQKSNSAIGELKTNAAELMKKLETKRG